jgi:PPOX class probable F420-dependent enzyme
MAIVDEKYVLLTTFRKSGDPVSTPVWIAALPDGAAGFTTDPDVGKVKRIRNTPRVTLQACGMRGEVKPGSEVVEAKATVKVGNDAAAIHQAIRKKYPVVVSLMAVPAFFTKLIRRKPATECAIHLTFG